MDINGHIEAARAAPVAVGLTLWGITLNEWVALATLFYLTLQIFILAPKAVKLVREWFR